MADIFISYARADREKIEELASALEADGYSVWWDRHIEGGAEFSKDIERELAAAKAVIVAWSKDSIQSRWVKDEAGLAAEAGQLVSIALDGSSPPIGFKQFHAIDFSGDEKSARDHLMRSLASKLGGAQRVAAPVSLTAPLSETKSVSFSDPKIWGGALAVVAMFLMTGLLLTRKAPSAPPPIPAGTEKPEKAVVTEIVNTATAEGNVVAVLPFANRSANADDAFFADGMHDDLLTKLSKISALQVISRTSVLRFRDTEQPIPEIADALGAAAVMEGAVQRAGNRVRINVQLIDGKTDQHLWAEIYDRELTAENIFDIQEEITRAIAGALEAVLSGDDEAELGKRPTENVAAYNAYLRALSIAPQVYTITGDQIDRAISALDEAIALDPDFASAYARKGYTQLMAYWLLGRGDAWKAAARDSLEHALSIAPNDIETLYAQGYYHYWGELDYDAADAVFDKLLSLAPNHANAISAKAFTQRRRGNFDEALAGLLRVETIDPLDISNFFEVNDTAATAGRWDVAEAALERAGELEPRHPGVAAYGYFFARETGDVARAWREINRPIDGADYRHYLWRLQAAILSRSRTNIETALNTWPLALRTQETFPEAYELAKAEALIELGDRDEAMAILARAKETIELRETPYPGGWSGNAVIAPVALPGLMGDLPTVARLVDQFEASSKPDAQGNPNIYVDVAVAFARAGDPDRAIDYLERITDIQGALRFAEFAIIPAFDELHEFPRWKAMKAQYDAWAEENLPAK